MIKMWIYKNDDALMVYERDDSSKSERCIYDVTDKVFLSDADWRIWDSDTIPEENILYHDDYNITEVSGILEEVLFMEAL